MSELKPCPFCGGEAFMVNCRSVGVNTNVGVGYYVACKNDNCQGEGNWDLGESGAEYAWNTRPLEDALQAERDALKEEYRLLNETYDADIKFAGDALKIVESERDLLRQQLEVAKEALQDIVDDYQEAYSIAFDALAEIAKLGEKK